MYLIGPIHIPPEILNLNRNMQLEEEWYGAFTYLR